MQAPLGTAEGASTLAKLKGRRSENPHTQRHNNSRTRASRHFPDRGKPTPPYVSCLALSSREGRNKVTQPTSVRRLVIISLVRQPLVRWSSITVFIVFSFDNTFSLSRVSLTWRHPRNKLTASRVLLQIAQQGHITNIHQLCHPSFFVVSPSE